MIITQEHYELAADLSPPSLVVVEETGQTSSTTTVVPKPRAAITSAKAWGCGTAGNAVFPALGADMGFAPVRPG